MYMRIPAKLPRLGLPVACLPLLLLGSIGWFSTRNTFALSADVVLAEIYGGGGNATAVYTNDYIVLFNRRNSSVTVSNWSVQYEAATGSSWQVSTLPHG